MKNQLHNIKPLKEFRKDLRNNCTPAEATLWKFLQKNKLGKKFRRQHSVGNYILDFYCPDEKLAIELDGQHHYTNSGLAYDQERTAYLNHRGIKVIRFENEEVFQATEEVLATIKSHFTK